MEAKYQVHPPFGNGLHGYMYCTAPVFYKGRVSGTGFFLSTPDDTPNIFVTCKHIFCPDLNEEKWGAVTWEDGEWTTLLHGSSTEPFPDRRPTNEAIEFKLLLSNALPVEGHDVVGFQVLFACLDAPQVSFVCIPESIIPDRKKLLDVHCFHKTVLIGYPLGLWDRHNNLPIPRTGIVASPPSLDHKGELGCGIHATPCYPCDSGGPVFAVIPRNEPGRIGGKEYVFLGIHTGGEDSQTVVPLDSSLPESCVPLPVGRYLRVDVWIQALMALAK